MTEKVIVEEFDFCHKLVNGFEKLCFKKQLRC